MRATSSQTGHVVAVGSAAVEQPLPITGTKEVRMDPVASAIPATATGSDLPAVNGDGFLHLIERLSIDERIDPVKLGLIFDLKRGLEADRAKIEYQQAFAAMSEKLPVITKKGAIKNKAGQVQSKYARYEDIQRVIKPILREFGFTLNHEQTPDNSAEMVLTTFLIHRGGHSQRSTFRAKADESGSKNDVQGLGSIASYAKRYNVSALLDLETHGEDDDATAARASQVPPGFDEFLAALDKAAGNGIAVLNAAWSCSENIHKNFILVKDWEAIKAKAKASDKAAADADAGKAVSGRA